MRAFFVGPGGSFVAPFGKLLMLRDNVQHHLQAGRITGEYFWIHELADTVLVTGRLSAPAREFWAEIARAFARICDVRIQDLAMSIRTHAIVSGLHRFPAVRGTVLVRLTRWRIPIPTQGLSTLGELFADVRSGIERVAVRGGSRARIEISSQPSLLLVRGSREGSADAEATAGTIRQGY